jgi:hypothetical protein
VAVPGSKGNTNALKHGLYAKQFNETQRLGLKRMDWDDFKHEEFAHRAIGAGIFRLLQVLLAQETPDIEQVIRLANALSNNTISTCTSARTHVLLNGQDDSLGDALSEALDNVPFDL